MRKFFKIVLIVVGCLLLLVVGAVVYLNTPWGMELVRSKGEAFLQSKLKKNVTIGRLGYGLPKYIVLERVFVPGPTNDTLLALGELRINLDMLQLLKRKVSLGSLTLTGVHGNIYRNLPDTTFNFNYIIQAFAGDNSDKPDTTAPKPAGKPWQLDIGLIRLADIHLRLNDATGGMSLAVDLNELELTMEQVRLQDMLFHIKSLSVKGLAGSYVQSASVLPVSEKTNSESPLKLLADNISIQATKFVYTDQEGNMDLSFSIGDLALSDPSFDLLGQKIGLQKLSIANTGILVHMGKTAMETEADTANYEESNANWQVAAKELELKGVDFRMDNDNTPPVTEGMDYAHLYAHNIKLHLVDGRYTTDSITGNLLALSLTEKSGLELQALRTQFTYNDKGAVLKRLYLQTPETRLQHHLEVHYPSIATLKENLDAMTLDIDLDSSSVSMKDVLLFAPTLRQQPWAKQYATAVIGLGATLKGRLSDLDIKQFYASLPTSTYIALSGRLSGLPDANKLKYDLQIARLQSTAEAINPFIPDSARTSFRLPDQFLITGRVAGTIKDYAADLMLVSNDGRARIQGLLALSGGTGKEVYDLVVTAEQLNLGKILRKDSLLGVVTATIAAKGHSFDMKQADATVDASVHSAVALGYRYHDITLYGKAKAKTINFHVATADSNLRLHTAGTVDFNGKYPALKADMELDSINLQALKFYATELRMSGTFHLDFPVLNPDYPQGSLIWWKPIITANGTRYYLDSMMVVSAPTVDGQQHIVADLNVLHATITGHAPITAIGPIIQQHIGRHYITTGSSSDTTIKVDAVLLAAANKIEVPDTGSVPKGYNLQIAATISDKPLLRSLLPGLDGMDPISLKASVDDRKMELDVFMPEVVYGTTTIMGGVVTVRAVDSALTYKITADRIEQGSIGMSNAILKGKLHGNNLSADISLSDNDGKEQFALGMQLFLAADSQIISIAPALLLDYKQWVAAQPNRIVLTKEGFYISNFSLKNNGQHIYAASRVMKPNTPIDIDIAGFALSNITNAISNSDTLLANGVLTGKITLEKMTPVPVVNGGLEIKDLVVMGDTLGNMTLDATNSSGKSVDATLKLLGHGNDLALKGAWYSQTTDGNDFNFNLDVNALSLRSLESIAQHQMNSSSGFLRGKLVLNGKVAAPIVTGKLVTDELATTITLLNARFKMPAEQIDFTKDGVSFRNFTIADANNNKAELNGTVNTTNLSKMAIDMKVRANNWQALHATAVDNETFYGDLLLTTNLQIKGPLAAPNVSGDLKILKGTNMTIVNKESNPEMESRKGIVVFKNMKDTGRRNILQPKQKKRVAKNKSTKSNAKPDVNVNVSVDKEAQFSVIVDQTSGDYLTVRGDANMNAALTPGGVLSLSGSYALTGGAYQFSYRFVKRKFLIREGSSITFAGDPVKNTNMNITAAYVANAPAYDLMQRQVTDQAQLNYYKQRIPFDVLLHLSGPILKPGLTFDVDLPEEKNYRITVEQAELIRARLSQIRTDTSEMNKQVFALLILNRFVAEDPFSSQSGSSAKAVALQSVSNLIGQQLNGVANRLVKGVDFSVDLATADDYTSGSLRQRTDLNLAASKQLLNDRLKLTVGNNFELEGPQSSNQTQTGYVPSNLAADYLLTSDGKYTLRAYRKTYDVGVLQGFVTEAGLNFIVSLDYNKFSTVLNQRKIRKQREARRASRVDSAQRVERAK